MGNHSLSRHLIQQEKKKERERESIRMRPELPQNRDKQAMFLGSRVLAADGREAPIGVPDGSLL